MKSSKGKVYYFHLKTQNSQWIEPADWKELEEKETIEEEEAAAARLAALQGWRWRLHDSTIWSKAGLVVEELVAGCI